MGFLYYRPWIRGCLLVAIVAAVLTPQALTAGWRAEPLPDGQETVNAALDADGRAFTFVGPGMTGCRAGWSATIEINGTQRVLSSADGQMLAPAAQTNEATPYGLAKITETIIRFEKEQVDLLFRLGQVPGVPGVLAQAGIRNGGQNSVNLFSVTPVTLEGQVLGPVFDWLVTPLDTSIHTAQPMANLQDLHEPLSVHEYGGLYRKDGTGFLFGPVGTPIAYVDALVMYSGNGKISFLYSANMSSVCVAPGAIRWGQQVVLLLEPPHSALARWAEWVAKTHGACTDKGALSGWNSWNFLGQKVTGNDILAIAKEVSQSQNRLRPGVIQIDQGYQDESGQKESNDKFPEGLSFYAQRIAATGARPGLFLDVSGITGAQRQADSLCRNALSQSVRRAVSNGFTYFKIKHLLSNVMPSGTHTSFEMCRDDYAAIREAAGTNAYLLHSEWQPNRATVGFVDASRTGADANRAARSVDGISQSDIRFAIVDTLRSYQLNGRWFAVDNDTYYTGTDKENLSEIAGKWPPVRTWMSIVGLSCGMAITSDPWNRGEFNQYLHNVQVMTPPAKERTEVIDLCVNENWPRLVGHVRRAWGDWTVALLWNPLPAETPVWLDFARAGMDPKRRYAVWSFWDTRFLGVAKGSWATPAMQPLVSQHLCFTDLDCTPNKPVLIGSSLHIYCGAVEIKKVVSLPGAMTIELNDAGASEGDLFVYSKWMPFLKTASGCTVRSVINVGENAWRISVIDRKSGVPQRISLGILLPVNRQTWFWVLIAVVAGSLLFALWRYVIGLRLQRVHALEQERIRIARDMHDEIGSSLTKIGKLAAKLADPAIAKTAREVVQAMDEIVWTVNPRNDTLESLADYLVHYTEDFLRPMGIAYELDVALELPDVLLSAEVRHNVFMAVKEALNNAVKHAAPQRIRLGLAVDGERLTLRVQDDGCGFSPGASAVGADGLRNMRQRLAAINGELVIASAQGQGTTLTLQVRLNRKRQT